MLESQKIYEDIESLPEEARTLLVDYIEQLKKRFAEPKQQESEKTLYEKFEESGFVGCCSVEENLSITYKEVMADTLNQKYDHR